MRWCLCQGKLARLQSRSLHRGATFPERSIILVLAKFSPWKMEDKKLTNNFCHRRNRDNKQDPAELGENQNEASFEVWTSVFVCSICIPDRTHGPSSGPPKNRSSGVGCCGAKSSGGNLSKMKSLVWCVRYFSFHFTGLLGWSEHSPNDNGSDYRGQNTFHLWMPRKLHDFCQAKCLWPGHH